MLYTNMDDDIFNKYYTFLTQGLFLLALLFILAGLGLNSYFFAKLVSYDGILEPSTKQLILSLQVANIVIGFVLGIISWKIKYISPKGKEYIINVSFLLFTTIFFFLVLEIGLRFISPSPNLFSFAGTDPAVFQESTIIPWTLKPNASAPFVSLDFNTEITINSFGLRDKNRTLEKDINTYRIIAVGDSFTYGFGVNNNETYPAILEDLLNRHVQNKQFEVWNAGFASGYTEDTFYLYLREKGLQFKPDMILVGLYVENDVLDFLKNNYTYDDYGKLVRVTSNFYHVENGKLRRGGSTEFSIGKRMKLYLKKFLLRYSKIYAYFYNAFSSMAAEENNPIFDEEYSDIVQENFEKVKYYLKQIKALGDEHNIPVVVILLPGKTSVDALWETYLSKNPKSIRDKPEKILLSYCEELNITCLDLWPYFTHNTEGEKYYFEHDVHWSREGNQKGAEIIYQLMKSGSLISME